MVHKIEAKLKRLIEKDLRKETFIFDFLKTYDLPQASITRLKKGDLNLSKVNGELLLSKKIFFKKEYEQDLHLAIENLRKDKNLKVRFIVVTDFNSFLSIDKLTGDTLDIAIKDLPKHVTFFLPLAGMEKTQIQDEGIADRKAAEKLAKLYDLIIENNSIDPKDLHSLNVFLSRLLFCFFAEDTNLFKKDYFTKSIASHTKEDGSDLISYLKRFFERLNNKNSSKYPIYLQNFPYVNGGLFKEKISIPKFSKKSRKIILECGSLNWKDINPDIFGSMIQAVVDKSQKRGNLGIHYTSVENMMKVIKPLFLDELYMEFEEAKGKKKNLQNLLNRLRNIKIFDPACGSGNFLIIAYKELCRLEIKILKKLSDNIAFKEIANNIKLNQFYGIEIDDFAHETAKLSLYLAEHQMNLEFESVFNKAKPTLPLKEGGNIVCGNAIRMNWEEVCPKNENSEVYILGNPPYLGSKLQKQEQKADLKLVAEGIKNFKNLDYISCWFIKASDYILNTSSKFAFVSTNSICQGEQVVLLWKHILLKKVEIDFAYQSFKWTNNAKGNAGVTCIIVGIRNIQDKDKLIFKDNLKTNVKNINPYLIPARNIFIEKRMNPLSDFKRMCFGNMEIGGGNLILSESEKKDLISKTPATKAFIRQLYGSRDFLNGINRYCLWIYDKDINSAVESEQVLKRIENCRKKRLSNPDTHALAKKPHQFREMKEAEKNSLIIPMYSSERRHYIPIGYLSSEDIILAPNQAIYDPPNYLFSILTSRMHMTWVRAVGGRLETRYRYSSSLCYNTFPFPKTSKKQEKELEELGFSILDTREKHSEKTLAELYDPDKMPDDLKQAHLQVDLAIDKCYRKNPFKDDRERLGYLFTLYEEMINKEKGQEKRKGTERQRTYAKAS